MKTFDTFKQEALDAGFDEVLERQWGADIFLDTHTHPFSVRAMVQRVLPTGLLEKNKILYCLS